MRIKVLIINLLLFSNISFGQSAKEAFTKVNNTFKSIDKISYSINYSYYLKATDVTPYETMKGEYKKVNNSYYSKTETRELIVNDNYRLVIDNASKHFLIEDKPESTISEQFVVDIDTALSLCSKITSSSKSTVTTYKMFFNEEIGYSQINVTIDTKTNFIKKLDIYLVNQDGTKPKLSIAISNYNTNPSISESYFSEKKYVNIDGAGNVNLNKKYSSFTSLNNKVSNQ